ncbi:MAG TPA: flagellar motor protein MotD [Rhodanobacter sp.]|nr:flagellar motor protein MotD [Rhodanobacter sp.]
MRKHRHEEHLNHEAWAIPYADLMTLLLAFFVVMYAVSVVNEGKYRVMSESLIQAFNGSSSKTTPPPPEPSKANTSAVVPAVVSPGRKAASPIVLPIPLHSPGAPADHGPPEAGQHNLDDIESQVRRALQPLIDRKMVVVRHTKDWLEIEIRTDILFPSGVAQLSSSADVVLQNLATILAPFPNPLRVEGFTDNVPISTAQYPSNWELSAARAASVARLFALSGVAPDRLGIVGWGEVRPLVDNATADGRNQNRRVLVVVMKGANGSPRRQSDAGHLGEIAATAMPQPVLEGLTQPAPTQAAAAPEGDHSGLPRAPSPIAAELTEPGHVVGHAVPGAGESARATTQRVSPDR